MGHAVDPRVQRFLLRQAAGSDEALRADANEARAATPAQRWEQLLRLSRSLGWLLTQPPEHQARVLEWRDPPAPGWVELVARHRPSAGT